MIDAAALKSVEWVFAYGSLMWNPGFDFIDRQPARLDGFHRAFCIYSHHYRGTPARPGLCLGWTRAETARALPCGSTPPSAMR